MILSDRDIRAALQRPDDPLIVDPGFDPARLQPASLELTLAHDILIDVGSTFDFDTGRKVERPMADGVLGERGKLLYPNDFWLASTVEKVHIPRDLVAQVNGKSSHALAGAWSCTRRQGSSTLASGGRSPWSCPTRAAPRSGCRRGCRSASLSSSK